jgi:hypothetical protein
MVCIAASVPPFAAHAKKVIGQCCRTRQGSCNAMSMASFTTTCTTVMPWSSDTSATHLLLGNKPVHCAALAGPKGPCSNTCARSAERRFGATLSRPRAHRQDRKEQYQPSNLMSGRAQQRVATAPSKIVRTHTVRSHFFLPFLRASIEPGASLRWTL